MRKHSVKVLALILCLCLLLAGCARAEDTRMYCSASGSFTVASGWGEGKLNFCAMAVVDRTGDRWNSNVIRY